MARESGSRDLAYCRKQKSLGLLCTNFLSLYDRDGIETIGLDDAATRLGVERRRIYDIVNVLESVGILARKMKNSYSWKGFGGVPKVLQELKEKGFKEGFNTFEGSNTCCSKASDDEDENSWSVLSLSQDDKSNHSSVSGSSMASKAENRKEKSLGILTQNFVKLFLCSCADLISLEEAAKILLGDGHNAPVMRTKVRRLYDIANVLSSMNFIEKTHHPETRKPAFRWLGMKRKAENRSKNDNILNESKKRMFGTDISNDNSLNESKKRMFGTDISNDNSLNESKKRMFGTDISNDNSLNESKKRMFGTDISNDNSLNESKKRIFGTDISNISLKRSKVTSQFDGEPNDATKASLKMNVKSELLKDELNTRHGRIDYRFGPFAPINVPKAGSENNNRVKKVADFESLASTYRPQYHNQALNDLFSHYAEAWKSWYSEVAGKSQLIS